MKKWFRKHRRGVGDALLWLIAGITIAAFVFGILYSASLKIVASNEIYHLVYNILLGCLTVAIVLFTVLNHYNKNRDRAKIYTHNVAADIVGEFEDLLDKHDITIPDEEREGTEDEARIYGQAYDELLYKTEISLISLLTYCENGFEIIPDKFK